MEINMEKIILQFDGASRGNPGKSAIGFILIVNNKIIKEFGECIGEATNNQAEYTALLKGVRSALETGLRHIKIEGDSLLVIKQVLGDWKVYNSILASIHSQVMELLKKFETIELAHIPRDMNKRSDKLCNLALDGV